MKIGFIGLGQMGRGMVSRLLDSGHELIVWNRTRAAAEAFATRGAVVAPNAQETLTSDVVITMLADDAAVEAVWVDSRMVSQLPTTSVHLNMASVSPRMGEALDALHRRHGSRYVSAPVFGRPEFAARGELDIVAAGAPEALALCEPLFKVLGRRWFKVADEAPKANALKVARNFLLATIIEGLGEAMALAQRAGIDPRVFHHIVTSTAMNSSSHINYGRLMLDNPDNPTFPLKLGLKDVELALNTAAGLGLTLPTAELLRKQHHAAIAAGYGERDWAALGTYIMDSAAGRIGGQSAPPKNEALPHGKN